MGFDIPFETRRCVELHVIRIVIRGKHVCYTIPIWRDSDVLCYPPWVKDSVKVDKDWFFSGRFGEGVDAGEKGVGEKASGVIYISRIAGNECNTLVVNVKTVKGVFIAV